MAIDALVRFEANLPAQYGWRYRSDEAFVKAARRISDTKQMNLLYWLDQSANIEAHACMVLYRSCELLRPAIRSLNIGEIVAAGVLARSLLELAVTFIDNLSLVRAIIAPLEFPPDTVITSQELEDAVVKMIWGTRLGDPEPHLKQRNVLTTLQKLSKLPHVKDLLPTYEYLCELAHPNVMGNARFWGRIEAELADGSVRVVIERNAQGGVAVAEIVSKVIWSLEWASESIGNGFAANRESLQMLHHKLGISEK